MSCPILRLQRGGMKTLAHLAFGNDVNRIEVLNDMHELAVFHLFRQQRAIKPNLSLEKLAEIRLVRQLKCSILKPHNLVQK